jgi:hypothetical protein
VISRVWCASLPCPQLDTGRRDWLALVDFKLHHCRFPNLPRDEIQFCYTKQDAFATVCSLRGGHFFRPDSSPPFLPAVYLREILSIKCERHRGSQRVSECA